MIPTSRLKQQFNKVGPRLYNHLKISSPETGEEKDFNSSNFSTISNNSRISDKNYSDDSLDLDDVQLDSTPKKFKEETANNSNFNDSNTVDIPSLDFKSNQSPTQSETNQLLSSLRVSKTPRRKRPLADMIDFYHVEDTITDYQLSYKTVSDFLSSFIDHVVDTAQQQSILSLSSVFKKGFIFMKGLGKR
ncbi:hypothetical protein GEMRC1_012844 [Eukaryota sp. GEM-RC1]